MSRACVNCGDPFRGKGTLCGDCRPVHPPPPRRFAGRCPYCRAVHDWDTVLRSQRRHTDGTVEAIYYCPACRAILEFAAWVNAKRPR